MKKCRIDAHRHYGIAIRLLRRTYYRAQGGCCYLCGKPLSPRFSSPKLTIEHVWPRSRAAAQTYDGDLLLAHSRCNGAKADRLPTGCERLMLFAVNRRLGFAEHETAMWDAL